MGYGPRKFRPVAGARHRAMVRSALSIYEDGMGRYVGRGRAVQAGHIRDHFEHGRGCSRRQKELARAVARVRNNEAHFAGGAFGFDRARKDVHLVADALDSFGLRSPAAEVRAIVAEAGGSRRRRAVAGANPPARLAGAAGGLVLSAVLASLLGATDEVLALVAFSFAAVAFFWPDIVALFGRRRYR